MAKKAETLHLALWGFVLTALAALGAIIAVAFNVGKDVGAYEERLAQVERQMLERPTAAN